jgi:REP element-mobilizing transposase RayT
VPGTNTCRCPETSRIISTDRPSKRCGTKLRLQFEDAYYHLFSRGNRRARLFFSTEDYQQFEDLLLYYAANFGIELYSWCMMPNHFHILACTPGANVAAFMHCPMAGYAKYFNARYRLVGHVFQGRYGSRLVDSEEYLLELIRYTAKAPRQFSAARGSSTKSGQKSGTLRCGSDYCRLSLRSSMICVRNGRSTPTTFVPLRGQVALVQPSSDSLPSRTTEVTGFPKSVKHSTEIQHT